MVASVIQQINQLTADYVPISFWSLYNQTSYLINLNNQMHQKTTIDTISKTIDSLSMYIKKNFYNIYCVEGKECKYQNQVAYVVYSKLNWLAQKGLSSDIEIINQVKKGYDLCEFDIFSTSFGVSNIEKIKTFMDHFNESINIIHQDQTVGISSIYLMGSKVYAYYVLFFLGSLPRVFTMYRTKQLINNVAIRKSFNYAIWGSISRNFT